MRKKVAHWITGLVISAIAIHLYLFLFHTNLFSGVTISLLNEYLLKPINLRIQGQLEGGLLAKSIGIRDARLMIAPSGDTLLVAKELAFDGVDIDWASEEILIDHLKIQNSTFSSQHIADFKLNPGNTGSNKSIIVKQLVISQSKVNLHIQDSLQTFHINNLQADMWRIDGYTGINIGESELIVPILSTDTLLIKGLLGIEPDRIVNIDGLSLKSNALNLELDSKVGPETITARISGNNFTPSTYEYIKIPPKYADLAMNYDLNVNRGPDGFDINGSGTILNQDYEIPFQLGNYSRDKTGQKLTMELGTELNYLEINGDMDTLGALSVVADFFRIELDPVLSFEGINISEPIGQIRIKGSENSYTIKPRFDLLTINQLQLDSLTADIIINPDRDIQIANGLLRQTDNVLNFSGSITNRNINIESSANISDFGFLEAFSIKRDIQGEINSKLTITGDIKHPRIIGELNPDNFGIRNQLTLSGLGKYDIEIEDSGLNGYFALQGNQGTFLNDTLRSHTITANFSEKDYEIEEFHLQGSSNIISLSGFYGPSGIGLNKLTFTIDQNQLKLVDDLIISKSDADIFNLPPSVFAFNQGGLSLQGNYSQSQGLGVTLDFELIDFDQIFEFLGLGKTISGIGSGTAAITGNLNDPVIAAKFELFNGITIGYPSDTAYVDLTLKSHNVIGNRIDVVKDGGSLTLIGQLPWGYKMSRNQSHNAAQNFSINMNNYRLEDLKFKQVVGMPISGRANGSLAIRGTPLRTKLDGNIDIIDGRFDTLAFTSSHTEFIYEDNLVTFDSLSMLSTWGYGTGVGFMPISLDFVAEDRMLVADREMDLNFEFDLNEMPFLSSYISSIDLISGSFIGNLGITGSLANPVRDGKIRGHNGYLEVPVLGNPITDIHSEITIIDNTLGIDHFSGRMLFSEGSALNMQGGVGKISSLIGDLIGVNTAQDYNGVIKGQGTIDLNSFFHPRFDVTLNADEIYYRSTDGQIEAIADAELQFSGQDTLDVTAIIPVKRGAYYSNFESEETYQQNVSQTDSSIFRYSLNTQFASDMLISNDQMEAEFEGELWLLDYGDGIMRFSGTLKAQEGGKIFYVGNELRIVSGEIVFNSVDFNPQVNVETEIEIAGEVVTLTLTGDLNEPELAIINSENTQLTQSDVLAYLTINQKLVEVSFDTQSALNPVKTYSAMLVEKQLSKIGRDLTGLDILDVGINLDSDSTNAPTFRLGQRLSKNLKVTYEGGLQPIDGKSDYDFGLEYRINRNVSITSKVNQDGEVELNGRLKFTY